MNREQKQMARIGSVAALLVGILYLVVAVAHMLIPMEQRAAVGDGHGFYQSFSQDPTFSLIEWWSLGFLCLLGIAVVFAVYDRFVSLHAGWVRWTSALAILGFSVGAIIQFTSVGRHPVLAAGYMAGDASTRAAIASQPAIIVDPYSWLRFGIVGFWILVISVLGLRARAAPRYGRTPAWAPGWQWASWLSASCWARKCLLSPLPRWAGSFSARSGSSGLRCYCDARNRPC